MELTKARNIDHLISSLLSWIFSRRINISPFFSGLILRWIVLLLPQERFFYQHIILKRIQLFIIRMSIFIFVLRHQNLLLLKKQLIFQGSYIYSIRNQLLVLLFIRIPNSNNNLAFRLPINITLIQNHLLAQENYKKIRGLFLVEPGDYFYYTNLKSEMITWGLHWDNLS